jgi:hypothetical protein
MLDNSSELIIIAAKTCSTFLHFLLSFCLTALLEVLGISPLE